MFFQGARLFLKRRYFRALRLAFGGFALLHKYADGLGELVALSQHLIQLGLYFLAGVVQPQDIVNDLQIFIREIFDFQPFEHLAFLGSDVVEFKHNAVWFEID